MTDDAAVLLLHEKEDAYGIEKVVVGMSGGCGILL